MDIVLSNIEMRFPGEPERGDDSGLLFRLPSMAVPTGRSILIHGPSGRGKTTLLHLMAGQFLPAHGQVSVGSMNVTEMDDDARRGMRRRHFGIVFQRFNLIQHLTPVENILLGAAEDEADGERKAWAALREMGLDPEIRRPSGTLSPGEQQRVAVARALAFAPDIILADEPTSSLDRRNAEAVMAALCETARGRTLVVVSHDERIHKFFDSPLDFESLVQL